MSGVARRILVPIDFERGSRRAVRYARALAAASNGEICLLHVVPAPPGHAPTSSDKWWMTLAERTLAGLAERARLKPGTSTYVVRGAVAPSIGNFACENHFDLVILSGRSQPDWHGSLLGSTASAILRHARVPVLIVPTVRAARATDAAGTANASTDAAPRRADRRPA